MPDSGDTMEDPLAAFLTNKDREASEPEAAPETAPPPEQAPANQLAAAPPPRAGDVNAENRLGYAGQVDEIFKLWIINALLCIPTFGFYRFWGKTRLRRYVAEHVTLAGDNFEYLGSGKQMFLGFIKILPLMIAVSLPMFFAAGGSLFWGLISLLSIASIWYLVPVARYMALRYRVSRLNWRGIRGYMTGSPWEYGRKAVWWNFLNAITLGILKPTFDIYKARFKYGNLYFGNIKGEFGAEAGDVQKDYWISWGIGVYTVIVAGLLFAIPAVWSMKGQQFGAGGLMIFLGSVFLFAGFPVARYWYKAAFLRACINKYKIGNIRLHTDITFGMLLGFHLLNAVIIAVTLGIGVPIIVQRKLNFLKEHFTIIGDLDSQDIRQARDQIPGVAEGLDDALDLDSGLI